MHTFGTFRTSKTDRDLNHLDNLDPKPAVKKRCRAGSAWFTGPTEEGTSQLMQTSYGYCRSYRYRSVFGLP